MLRDASDRRSAAVDRRLGCGRCWWNLELPCPILSLSLVQVEALEFWRWHKEGTAAVMCNLEVTSLRAPEPCHSILHQPFHAHAIHAPSCIRNGTGPNPPLGDRCMLMQARQLRRVGPEVRGSLAATGSYRQVIPVLEVAGGVYLVESAAQRLAGDNSLQVDLGHASRLLFGRSMRLPLARWIRRCSEPSFYITEARKATGFDQKDVVAELERLTELRMITKLPRDRGNDRQYFVRQGNHPLWKLVDKSFEIWPSTDS